MWKRLARLISTQQELQNAYYIMRPKAHIALDTLECTQQSVSSEYFSALFQFDLFV